MKRPRERILPVTEKSGGKDTGTLLKSVFSGCFFRLFTVRYYLSMKIIDQGGVAQLGERDTGSVEVMGSSPTVSSYRRVCHFPFI